MPHVAAKDLYMVEIPAKDLNYPGERRTTTMRVPMILPHELLDFLTEALLNYMYV